MTSDDEYGFPRMYNDGDKVIVPHVDKFYDAKVVKAEYRQTQWFYLLHYQGWNKRWDEWVEESGMQPWDEEVMKQQQGLQDAPEPEAVPPPAPSKAAGPKTQVSEATAPQQLTALAPVLRRVLLADAKRMEEGQPYQVPRAVPFEQLIELYLTHVRAVSGNLESEEDTMNGLRLYFDTCLPGYLLYDCEREQADGLLGMGFVASSVYGVEHLLRLLVKLPTLLELAEATQQQMAVVQTRVQELLKWLAVNVSRFEANKEEST